MVLRRWLCTEHGVQVTYVERGADRMPCCPVCAAPMVPTDPPAGADPRRQRPPRGETRPL